MNYQNDGATPWGDGVNGGGGAPGVDYSSTEYASVTKSSADENSWFEWDITSLVQEWVTTPQENEGMMIKYSNGESSVSSNHKYFRFYASDTNDSEKRPKLVVDYTTEVTTIYYIRDAAGNVIASYKK